MLGLDEHFFTRQRGYATTFCDLKNHRIFDVVLGRSEAALERWQMAYLPVYAAWAALVVIVFPPVFGHR